MLSRLEVARPRPRPQVVRPMPRPGLTRPRHAGHKAKASSSKAEAKAKAWGVFHEENLGKNFS